MKRNLRRNLQRNLQRERRGLPFRYARPPIRAWIGVVTGVSTVLLAVPSLAHDPAKPPTSKTQDSVERLPEVVVEGRDDSLLGIVDSATQGTVGADELKARPIARTGEILETVPGVIITQHAGGGKANQYFLRGFNLDHGTDFQTSLDGMPVNLPSHGHGQGYSDINFVIPELIARVNFQKGVYYAQNADFSSAGAVQLDSFRVLPKSLTRIEGGRYGFGRAVFATSPKLGKGHLLLGTELYHYDGPWERANNYQRANAQLTYSRGDRHNGLALTLRAYHGIWESSDQIAESAVRQGLIGEFGALDNTTGGKSQRYSAQVNWNRQRGNSSSEISAYAFYYDLSLFSNFTYFAVDPLRGDQFEQSDRRFTSGTQGKHTFYLDGAKISSELTFGGNLRNDVIANGLYQTQARRRVDKLSLSDGMVLPARTRSDEIVQTSAGAFAEGKAQWTPWLRTVIGIRGDVYHFHVNANRKPNSGDKVAGIASPKFTLVAGPWTKTELYAQVGTGFHSNDARGVLSKVDPISGLSVDAEGNPIRGAQPLVRTVGAEFGVRSVVVPGLQTTLSGWWLDVESELLFVGDAGTTEASRPSRRFGLEWANFYSPIRGLTFDLDVSLSQARFRDNLPDKHIPGAIESVVAAGATYRSEFGIFGSARVRYFGSRPLLEDNSMRSKEAVQLNAQLGYRINEVWSVMADGFNLLNRRDHDIDYAYESRITPSAPISLERHYHPIEPLQVRLGLAAEF
jgi:hypothetical protein